VLVLVAEEVKLIALPAQTIFEEAVAVTLEGVGFMLIAPLIALVN